jgi:hypothetical protein
MNKKTKLQECFVKSKASGYILNCPCGNSRIGNVLCDIDPNEENRSPSKQVKHMLEYYIKNKVK